MMANPDWTDPGDWECGQCGGEGYVFGCSWDWQCDTYDEGEGTCLCTRRCVCNPAPRDPGLDKVLSDALAAAQGGVTEGRDSVADSVSEANSTRSAESGCAQPLAPKEP